MTEQEKKEVIEMENIIAEAVRIINKFCEFFHCAFCPLCENCYCTIEKFVR